VSRADSRDKAQTALAIAFPGPARADPDRFAARIIAGIGSGLGGRFFDELRDRQSLAYTVHAYSAEHQLAGVFMSYIATSPEKEDVAREGLLKEFDRLRTERVSDDELERAKRYAVGSHAIRQESGGAVLGDMIDAWMLGAGLRELEEHDARIEAVTTDDVLRVAQEYFDPSRRAEGVVRGVGKTV
jgi:zinc protease